jgi:hypothetical protein
VVFGFSLFRMPREAEGAKPPRPHCAGKHHGRGDLGHIEVCERSLDRADRHARLVFKKKAKDFAARACAELPCEGFEHCRRESEKILVHCVETTRTCDGKGHHIFFCTGEVTEVECKCSNR